jgi:hypothetical protein
MKTPVRHKDLGAKTSSSRRISFSVLIHNSGSVRILTDLVFAHYPNA